MIGLKIGLKLRLYVYKLILKENHRKLRCNKMQIFIYIYHKVIVSYRSTCLLSITALVL